MELLKKNIHMDYRKCGTLTQMTLEDDMNIPDKCPDVSKILMNKGNVKLDEIKATQDHVTLRGKFLFQVLYCSDEWNNRLSKVYGSIPFEEQVYLEGVSREDNVSASSVIEDLTVGMINSRKINVQTVITWNVCVNELTDLETPVDVASQSPIEVCKEEMRVTGIGICKNDIFRIKEELELPSDMPNVEELIWESIRPENVTFKPMEEKIGISGELRVFFMYIGENDDMPVRYYGAAIPFHGEIECHGANSSMIPVITYEMEGQETEVRPDYDGEKRIFGMDLAMNLKICMYHEDTVSVITDMYAVDHELQLKVRPAKLQTLRMQNEGSYKLGGRIHAGSPSSHILQLLYTEATARVTGSRITPEGVEADGVLEVKGVFITGDDEMPYGVIHGNLPFRETIDAEGLTGNCSYQLTCQCDDANVSMVDSEEIDVKASVRIRAVVYDTREMDLIEDASLSSPDYEKLGSLPGMAILLFEQGDTLWNVGKQYCLPVQRLRELNGIADKKEPVPGSRILIVK